MTSMTKFALALSYSLILSVAVLVAYLAGSLFGGGKDAGLNWPSSASCKTQAQQNSQLCQQLFNWHPVLMTLGMVCLFAWSALSYRTLDPVIGHARAKIVHGLLHTVTLVCVGVGMVAVWVSLDWQGAAHFGSGHTWLGGLTLALWLTQYIVGGVSFSAPLSLVSGSFRAKLKPLHVTWGLAIFGLAGMCVATGLMEQLDYTKACSTRSTECIAGNFLILSVAALLCCVMYVLAAQKPAEIAAADETQALTDPGDLQIQLQLVQSSEKGSARE